MLTSPDVFRAVADPTRRGLLDLLLAGEKTASELADHFAVTQQAVSLHLQSLRKAGLVHVRKQGRFRRFRLRARHIRDIYEWAGKYRSFFDPYGHAWSFAPAPRTHLSRSRKTMPRRRRRQ